MKVTDEILLRADAICRLAGLDSHDVEQWSLVKGAVLNLVDDVAQQIINEAFDRIQPLVTEMVTEAVQTGADTVVDIIRRLSKEA